MRRNKTIVSLIVLAVLSYFGANTETGAALIGTHTNTTNSSKRVTCGSKGTASGIVYCVEHVVDGDTVDLDIDGKRVRVRLIGINTPETVDPRRPVECFGKEASNKAKEILSGKWVSIESDPTQDTTDKYGRKLLYIYTSDGTLFNIQMIREGYAHEYTYRYPYKYQQEFKNAEHDARTEERGLWAPTACSSTK